jgi:hypothetical protein
MVHCSCCPFCVAGELLGGGNFFEVGAIFSGTKYCTVWFELESQVSYYIQKDLSKSSRPKDMGSHSHCCDLSSTVRFNEDYERTTSGEDISVFGAGRCHCGTIPNHPSYQTE